MTLASHTKPSAPTLDLCAPMHLLQVCNVGQIVGGTAACAWTVTRALPDLQHTVLFLSRPTEETRQTFVPAAVLHASRVERDLLRRIDPDLVLLHNTAETRWPGPIEVPVIQYAHSVTSHAPADRTVACSKWLQNELTRRGRAVDGVLYQAVPIPPLPSSGERRALRTDLIIGRICTPTARKWPPELLPFYESLATRFRDVTWEFVGAPPDLEQPLRHACQNRFTFHPAAWSARRHLHRWDALLYHHPSLTESFGRTVAESLRAGCIPIVDRRGGFCEQFTPEAGFLCESDDDFAAALQAIQSPEQRWIQSAQCREEGDQRWSLERFRSDLLTWMSECAKSPLNHVEGLQPANRLS
jgi:glycosyltransferase involved in cell wall biosynthesis